MRRNTIFKTTFTEFLKVRKIKESMGDVNWASDGGYYNKRDTDILVSKEDAERINKAIEEFKRDIQNPESPIIVDKTERGQIFMKIIHDLQKNWNIVFENDTDERVDLFWLAPNQNMQDVNDGLENAWQLFYDKIQK